MNPDNSLNINVLEAVTPDQIDKNAIRSAMAEAQKVADSGKDEQEKLLASAQLEVYQALEKL
jgi:F-type H+-transporting ATPase subunit delta